MTDEFVCTLNARDVERRLDQSRRLSDGLLDHAADARAVQMTFEPALAEDVYAFVRDESKCCPFFDFAVTSTPAAVELRVTAPEGAEPMLDALVDAFTSVPPEGA